MGLIPARESLEAMRGEAESSVTIDSITLSHAFNTFDIEPYTNSSTIEVTSESTQIVIYRKVTITGTDSVACFDGGGQRDSGQQLLGSVASTGRTIE